MSTLKWRGENQSLITTVHVHHSNSLREEDPYIQTFNIQQTGEN